VAIRPVPPNTRSRRLTRHRRRARARARIFAVVLALAGLACVALGVRADPAPESAPPPRAAAPSVRTALVSARRVPALFVDAVAVSRLRSLLGTVAAPVEACVAVDDRSTPLVRLNSGRPLAAASTQKLLVAAAAL